MYVLSNQNEVSCIPNFFYANLLKSITFRPGNLEQNQRVLSQFHRGVWPRVPVRDRQWKHGVFISYCAAKRVAWGKSKEKQMPCLSLHEKLPARGLQETAFHNPKLFGANLVTTFSGATHISGSRAVRACEFQCPVNLFFFPLQCRSNPELQH